MIKDLFLKIIYNKLSKSTQKKILTLWKYLRFLHRNIISEIMFFSYLVLGIKIYNLNLFEQKFFSQNGEDGILRIIFAKVKTTNKFAVEFGISPYEGNTIYLKKKGWNCLWMDANGDGNIIKREFITAENINDLLSKYKVPREFDLLSIDIDFNDYWVWKSIDENRFSARVVVIEYNSSIPPEESKVVEYKPYDQWDGKTNYFGASLLALVNLARSKGYTLVCCDSKGVNAFFVRDDLIEKNFKRYDIKRLYKPPSYGKKVGGRYVGYPVSEKKMIDI